MCCCPFGAFPNLNIGLQETNGHQYYKNWDKMMTYHPKAGATWTQTQKGVYLTDKSFYEESGGIFQPSAHYEEMFKNAGKYSGEHIRWNMELLLLQAH